MYAAIIELNTLADTVWSAANNQDFFLIARNLDVINTISKTLLTDYITSLNDEKQQSVENALKFALDLS